MVSKERHGVCPRGAHSYKYSTQPLSNRVSNSEPHQELCTNKKRIHCDVRNCNSGDTDSDKTGRMFQGRGTQGLVKAKATRLLKWSGRSYN